MFQWNYTFAVNEINCAGKKFQHLSRLLCRSVDETKTAARDALLRSVFLLPMPAGVPVGSEPTASSSELLSSSVAALLDVHTALGIEPEEKLHLVLTNAVTSSASVELARMWQPQVSAATDRKDTPATVTTAMAMAMATQGAVDMETYDMLLSGKCIKLVSPVKSTHKCFELFASFGGLLLVLKTANPVHGAQWEKHISEGSTLFCLVKSAKP